MNYVHVGLVERMNCRVQMYTVHGLVRKVNMMIISLFRWRTGAQRGDVGEVKKLIESGVSVNSPADVSRLRV